MDTSYALPNTAPHALTHLQHIAEIFDHHTRTVILRTAGSLTGRRCLEVGAGGGSVAVWLAREAGAHGGVVATDLDPRYVPEHDTLRVVRHNIVTDPVDGHFDLIHARLVLNHLPEREEVVAKLAEHLLPGGVLVTEDITPLPGAQVVACAPTGADRVCYGRFQDAVTGVLTRHGVDPLWARRAYQAMVDVGLERVHAQVYARTWPGGSAGCRWHATTLRHLHDELHDETDPRLLTLAELDRVRGLLHDETFAVHSPLMYSTWGVKPA